MRLAVICFTGGGSQICGTLVKAFSDAGHDTEGWAPERYLSSCQGAAGISPLTEPLGAWTERQFQERDGLIYIGAIGIAVRAIAPFVKDKRTDPAVIVLDDMGRFSVSLLSGHLGGANELAEQAAEIVGAVPVITTATDSRGKFAVDQFAKERGLWLSDKETAKLVSADILDGNDVGFYSDFPVEGELPGGLIRNRFCRRNLWVTVRERADRDAEGILRLVPELTVLGIGCRKNTPEAVIEKAVELALERAKLSIKSVAAVTSVDLKKEEQGLTQFAGKLGVEFRVWTAGELSRVEGDFTASPFVKEVTGVDNVCERAALLWVKQHGGGSLCIRKTVYSGVTVAAAVLDWTLRI